MENKTDIVTGQNDTEANNKETLEKAVANLTQTLTNFQSTFQEYLDQIHSAKRATDDKDKDSDMANKTDTEDTDMENKTHIVTDGPMIDNKDTTETRPHKLEVPGIVAAFNFSTPTKTKTPTPITFDAAVDSHDRNRDNQVSEDELSSKLWNGKRKSSDFKDKLSSYLYKSFLDADINGDRDKQLSYKEFLKYTEGTPLSDEEKRIEFEKIVPTNDNLSSKKYHELFDKMLNSAIWYAAENA